ncbi:hypothetical protein BDW42DRAFT_154098 [Aspergillus taichungensis]|uniref:Uncharacterized protein n=1 Tax=Aspergillus taichungensis TaxID=482145 RepID=A0A2J5HKY8_9EURO|nr:hypothetical protein BDW42DRAFT_154098 [Aspergillus taichungensis]
MTVAAPPVAPAHENGVNGVPGHHHHHHHHLNMALPRFHPIAMNPNQQVHPDHLPPHHHFRHFPPPPPLQDHGHGPPGPPPPVHHLDHIEGRLRQLEHEEAARMAARSHLLAVRKREDEEFRRMTENAEAEEEELRRQRKRLKRESLGLGFNGNVDSPPLRPTPPRRLSETNAATTLAFFKQQSPPEPRAIPPPPPQIPPPHHHIPPPQHLHHHDPNGASSIRRKQKYTIKNVEAWGERHGRPASHDPSGRALWKRPSDGSLVYLTCPVSGCGKADFVTLHGFMCHLTKKHKDRSLGSQSRALEVCGIVFDPNAPLPPVSTVQRASTEESRIDSAPEGYSQEIDYSSASEEEEGRIKRVKLETAEKTMPPPPMAPFPPPEEPVQAPKVNGSTSTSISTKQTISSIIDRDPEEEYRQRERETSPPLRPVEPPSRPSPERRSPPTRDEAEIPVPPRVERGRSEPRDPAERR